MSNSKLLTIYRKFHNLDRIDGTFEKKFRQKSLNLEKLDSLQTNRISSADMLQKLVSKVFCIFLIIQE